jgi:hypothetical protein
VLGLWTSANEGAKFWLQVLTELQTRGVKDILIACVDGLKGFPEAIETAFPQTQVQLCICALSAGQPELCKLERAQESGDGSTRDVPRHNCTGRGASLRSFRGAMGCQVSDDCGAVAAPLGPEEMLFLPSTGASSLGVLQQPEMPVNFGTRS